jgi:hypothetical protein
VPVSNAEKNPLRPGAYAHIRRTAVESLSLIADGAASTQAILLSDNEFRCRAWATGIRKFFRLMFFLRRKKLHPHREARCCGRSSVNQLRHLTSFG